MSTTQSGAVLYQNPLRPFYVEDDFPIVYSNDIQGGIHGITSSSFLSEIPIRRRQWGMLAHTYNENTYYQLYPFKNTDISDDDNWILLSIGAGSNQWIDSVKGIFNDAPPSPSGGDRFIVGPGAAGTFVGQKNKIAVFNALTAGYSYLEPQNRSTLRVESDPYSIYTFLGTSSQSGEWSVERQNTVRYIYPTSDNGKTFSFLTGAETTLTGYTYSIYIANFATSNSGTVSISIDGNAYIPVKKVSTNSLIDLSANDFGANVDYMLSYQSGVFQIHLSSAGSGGTIGPAEAGDGTYTDGLYTDFTDSTPIGTAIDRFNEILKSLVPAPAPDLSSWSVSPQSQFVNGNVSYNSSTPGLSAYPGQSIGDSYNKLNYQLGITSKVSQTNTGTTYYQDITGVLNSGVNGSSLGSYASFSFGNGVTGSVVLYINGESAASVDLATDYGARDTTSGDTLTGFKLTAATNSRFSNGSIFDSFWNRAGTYLIKRTDSKLKAGYNFIQVSHILPNSTLTLTQYKFIADNSTDLTSYGTPTIQYNVSNTKYLSGIQYFTSGNVVYTIVANNVYRNTYYNGADACTFADETPSPNETSTIFNNRPVVVNVATNQAFAPSTSQISLPTPTGVNSTATLVATFVIQNNRRKLGGKSTFTTNVKRTVQGTVPSGGFDISGWFIDTFSSNSTVLLEEFNDEDYRLVNNNTGYDTISSSAPNWSSQSSLLTDSSYRNALQVADGRLLYPSFDFSDLGVSATNPNKGLSTTRDYRTCDVSTVGSLRAAANRTWTRRFNIGPTSWSVFNMKIFWSNVNWVRTTTTALSGNNCQIEVKLPGVSSKITGWIDAVTPLDPNSDLTIDGRGCLDGDVPASGGTWVVNLNDKSTSNSQGFVLIRITAGPDWNGYIESITLKGGSLP